MHAQLDDFGSAGAVDGWRSSGAWWMANLVDDQGTQFQLMRRFDGGELAQNFMSSRQAATLREDATPVFGPVEYYLGQVTITRGDTVEYRPADGGLPDFRLSIDADRRTSWTDADGRIDLTFAPTLSGVRFQHGGLMYYLTEPMSVSGTFLGRPVTGVGMFDAAYANPDPSAAAELFAAAASSGVPPTRDWIVFHNEYADGRRDFGLFIRLQVAPQEAPQGLCYCTLDDDTAVGTQCRIDPTYVPDGMIVRTDIEMDDRRFTFEPAAKIYDANPAKHWIAGAVRNEGLGASPTRSWAWYEWLAN